MHNEMSFMTENFGALANEGIRLMRHHTYIYCSPTRRAPCSRPAGSGPLGLGVGRAHSLVAQDRSSPGASPFTSPASRCAHAHLPHSHRRSLTVPDRRPISLNDPPAGVLRDATGPDVL